MRTLPKKITELGRIRIGDQEKNANGKGTHPHKLDTFRLTSSNKPLLCFAANLYGGAVEEWVGERAPEGHFQLYTAVNALDILVPTASALSISYEEWSAGGCTRRCTGEIITHCPLNEELVGSACQCPEDDKTRADAAKDGKACHRIARLNVLLPDLPGVGTWRLDTKGYYATAELLGSLELLAMAQHQIIEATLRLEQRSVKRWGVGRDGKRSHQSTPLKFAVPILWPKYTPRQMLAAADRRVLLMEPPQGLHEEHLPASDALFGGSRQPVVAAHRAPQQEEPTLSAEVQCATISELWRTAGKSPQEIQVWWDALCLENNVRTASQLSAGYLAQLETYVRQKTEPLDADVEDSSEEDIPL